MAHGRLKQIFNWFATHAKHDFTAGELFCGLIGSAPMESYEDRLFNRAGRIVERSVTLGCIFGAVAGGLVPGILAGVCAVAVGKCLGLATGEIAYRSAKFISDTLGNEKHPRPVSESETLSSV